MAAVMILFGGCDPGWTYTLPSAQPVWQDGLRYRVALIEGVYATFHANVFTISGYAAVAIVNESSEDVRYEPSPLLIADARGEPVKDKKCSVSEGAAPVVINKGYQVLVHCRFFVDYGSLFYYNRDFKFLTLTVPGVYRGEQSLTVRATMRWR